MLLSFLSYDNLFISFACPKEMNQRKRQPQIFFGINIFSKKDLVALLALRRFENNNMLLLHT
jgi:hypothetical protein